MDSLEIGPELQAKLNTIETTIKSQGYENFMVALLDVTDFENPSVDFAIYTDMGDRGALQGMLLSPLMTDIKEGDPETYVKILESLGVASSPIIKSKLSGSPEQRAKVYSISEELEGVFARHGIKEYLASYPLGSNIAGAAKFAGGFEEMRNILYSILTSCADVNKAATMEVVQRFVMEGILGAKLQGKPDQPTPPPSGE